MLAIWLVLGDSAPSFIGDDPAWRDLVMLWGEMGPTAQFAVVSVVALGIGTLLNQFGLDFASRWLTRKAMEPYWSGFVEAAQDEATEYEQNLLSFGERPQSPVIFAASRRNLLPSRGKGDRLWAEVESREGMAASYRYRFELAFAAAMLFCASGYRHSVLVWALGAFPILLAADARLLNGKVKSRIVNIEEGRLARLQENIDDRIDELHNQHDKEQPTVSDDAYAERLAKLEAEKAEVSAKQTELKDAPRRYFGALSPDWNEHSTLHSDRLRVDVHD